MKKILNQIFSFFALIMAIVLIACNANAIPTKPFLKQDTVVVPSSTPVKLDPKVSKTRTIDPALDPTKSSINQIQPTVAKTTRKVVGILHSTNDPNGSSNSDYFLDQNGAVLSSFQSGSGYLSIADNSCVLYGLSEVPKGILLTKMDFEGNIKSRQTIQLQDKYKHPWSLYSLSITPNGQWISYVWPSGEGGEYDPLDSEKLNLELLDVRQNNGKPFSVTEFGGATKNGGSWSPDGQSIAFSDRNLHGVAQIYILNLSTKQKNQVSDFQSTEVYSLKEVKYSPDGKKVAFLGLSSEFNQSEGLPGKDAGVVGVIYLEEQKTEFFELPKQYLLPRNTLWWSEDSGQFVTILEAANAEEKFWGNFVVWFDIEKKTAIKTHPDQSVQSFVISEVFPLRNIDKLIIYGKSSYTYDLNISDLNEIQLPNLCCSYFSYLFLNQSVDRNSCFPE